MNLSNRTIFTYFGGQDNFIFKIVLLDRFDCNSIHVSFFRTGLSEVYILRQFFVLFLLVFILAIGFLHLSVLFRPSWLPVSKTFRLLTLRFPKWRILVVEKRLCETERSKNDVVSVIRWGRGFSIIN